MANTIEIIIRGTDAASSVIRGVQGSLGGLSGRLSSVGKDLMGMGTKISAGVTLPLSLLAKQALGTAGDFEAGMNILAIAARSSGTAMEDLSKAAIAIGSDTALVGIDAVQAADAMTTFYKAGLTTADVFADLDGYLAGNIELTGALRAAVDLAAASDIDLAQASEVVAIAMATFGLSAEDAAGIADSFVGAADASVAEVSDLAEALKNVGPTMAQFGYSLEDTNTALALLSMRGITGAEAGTSLKSMMVNLMRPTKAVTGALADLNVSLYDNQGRLKSMPTIIGDLSKAMAGLTEEQRNQYIQTIAGTYGMKAMASLLEEGVVGWEEMEAAIGDCASAQEVGAARTKGFKAAMAHLNAAVKTLMITAITPILPMLTALVQRIKGIIDRAIAADPKLLQLGLIIGAVAMAIGPLLIVLGAMASGLGILLSPIGLIIGAVALLGAAWATSLLGIRDIITGLWDSTIKPFVENVAVRLRGRVAFFSGEFLTAMATSLRLAGTPLGDFYEMAISVISGIMEIAQATWPRIQEIFRTVWGAIQSIITTVMSDIVPKITEGFQLIMGWVDKNWPRIQAIIETVWGAIHTVIQAVIDTVVPFIVAEFDKVVLWVNANWPLIQRTIETVLNAVLAVVEKVVGWIAKFWEDNHGAILNVVNVIWNTIKLVIDTAINAVLTILKTIMQIINGNWEGAWTTIQNFASTTWGKIKLWWEDTTARLKAVWDEIGPKLQTAWDTIWDAVSTKAIEIWDTIKTFVTDTLGDIRDWIDTQLGEISAAWESVWGEVENKVREIWGRIKTFLVNVFNGPGQIMETLTGAFNNMVTKAGEFGRKIMEALKRGILAIKLPLPTFSISWESGPLGISIPKLNIGVAWRSIGDILGISAANAVSNAVGPAMAGAGIANALSDIIGLPIIGPGDETGLPIIGGLKRLIREEFINPPIISDGGGGGGGGRGGGGGGGSGGGGSDRLTVIVTQIRDMLADEFGVDKSRFAQADLMNTLQQARA